MDTKKKGDELENDIYELFSQEIANDRFLAKKEQCQVFKQKGYYSRDRGTDILFDVSIEITFPNQESYSILILIECKNYNEKNIVSAGAVEEFYAKAQQVGGCGVKGIFVTTSSFQSSAISFAESKKIGLIRYYKKECLDWVLTRSPSSMVSSFSRMTEWTNAYQGINLQNHESRYFDCYGFVDNIYTNSLYQFVSYLLKNDMNEELSKSLADIEVFYRGSYPLVPYMKAGEIEALSQSLLDEINYEGGAVSLEEICKILCDKNNLRVNRNVSLDIGIYGMISFDPLLIEIDDDQAETEQGIRFTLAHELGHFCLGHYKYMEGESCHSADVNLENPRSVEIKDIMRMEWQANYFASCLLLPKKEFVKKFLFEAKENDLSDRGYGLIYLDNQKCNQESFYSVTTPLINEFHVSRSVVKIRLDKLGYLNEENHYQS